MIKFVEYSGITRLETPDMCKSPVVTGNSLEIIRHISYNIDKRYECLCPPSVTDCGGAILI